jgi:hypothetical protein
MDSIGLLKNIPHCIDLRRKPEKLDYKMQSPSITNLRHSEVPKRAPSLYTPFKVMVYTTQSHTINWTLNLIHNSISRYMTSL